MEQGLPRGRQAAPSVGDAKRRTDTRQATEMRAELERVPRACALGRQATGGRAVAQESGAQEKLAGQGAAWEKRSGTSRPRSARSSTWRSTPPYQWVARWTGWTCRVAPSAGGPGSTSKQESRGWNRSRQSDGSSGTGYRSRRATRSSGWPRRNRRSRLRVGRLSDGGQSTA